MGSSEHCYSPWPPHGLAISRVRVWGKAHSVGAAGIVWAPVPGRLSQAHAGSRIPTTEEKDTTIDQHSREVIGDERGPDEGEARAEEVGEDPGEGYAESPVAHGSADERRDGVSRAAQDSGEGEVSAHEGLRDR